ncbi:hypothetical protein SKAU_G00021210 [Synaphobranchus kaupii]|uniref:CxC3 like cysteine cluster domain-containing protein n=1 Tax=Synaphobranchus kaupii TaxID=118154 RepID=A0A9Q1JD54_SYNKA|nr:hypothetical protein SKAU_G00021210 [Synaphobranchus kaupii]
MSRERWEAARHYLLDSKFAAAEVKRSQCHYCERGAVIRCLDCLPRQFFCGECDIAHHQQHHVLHNRDSMLQGFFQAIPPTVRVTKDSNGHHSIVQQGRFDLNVPHLSCTSCGQQWEPAVRDLIMLEQRSLRFGRVGKICRDSFQQSFRQHNYVASQKSEMMKEDLLICPACHPNMLAVSADGEETFYKDVFFAKDEDVATFVETIQMEMKGKDLAKQHNISFFCTDQMCRYWPYLERVVGQFKDLGNLLSMKPVLSVLHAKAHTTKCEVMLVERLTEEEGILLGEMAQHCVFLQKRAGELTNLLSEVTENIRHHSFPSGHTDEGHRGLMCLLKKTLHLLLSHQGHVKTAYRNIISCDASMHTECVGEVELKEDELEDDVSESEAESSDAEFEDI